MKEERRRSEHTQTMITEPEQIVTNEEDVQNDIVFTTPRIDRSNRFMGILSKEQFDLLGDVTRIKIQSDKGHENVDDSLVEMGSLRHTFNKGSRSHMSERNSKNSSLIRRQMQTPSALLINRGKRTSYFQEEL